MPPRRRVAPSDTLPMASDPVTAPLTIIAAMTPPKGPPAPRPHHNTTTTVGLVNPTHPMTSAHTTSGVATATTAGTATPVAPPGFATATTAATATLVATHGFSPTAAAIKSNNIDDDGDATKNRGGHWGGAFAEKTPLLFNLRPEALAKFYNSRGNRQIVEVAPITTMTSSAWKQ